MQLKQILFFIFIAVAAVQLYVPAKMIFDSELVLTEGKAYKFKTQPIDPYDPFRGMYITLRYDANEFPVDNPDDWARDESVYVTLMEDADGYAAIEGISKKAPKGNVDYVRASVDYVRTYSDTSLIISYPFDRFYMEESKAFEAEVAVRESQRDTSEVTYALVHIKKGAPIIKDVFINDTPIREIVIARNEMAENEAL